MEKVKELIKKIKSIKYIEVYFAIILIILCIIIYFLVMNTTEKVEPTAKETDTSLSGEIECLLESMEGVGDCKVLITYKSINCSEIETANYTNEEIEGVVVVCDGANDIRVVEKITTAIVTLLNVDSLKVRVYKS